MHKINTRSDIVLLIFVVPHNCSRPRANVKIVKKIVSKQHTWKYICSHWFMVYFMLRLIHGSICAATGSWSTLCYDSYLEVYMQPLVPGLLYVTTHTWKYICSHWFLVYFMLRLIPGSIYAATGSWSTLCYDSYNDVHPYLMS